GGGSRMRGLDPSLGLHEPRKPFSTRAYRSSHASLGGRRSARTRGGSSADPPRTRRAAETSSDRPRGRLDSPPDPRTRGPRLSHEGRRFEEGFVAVRSYKDVIEVPASARRLLPSSFDVVGDIAIIKIPEELRARRMAIGDAIRRWNPKIGVVLEDRGVKGEHRIREIDVIAGEPRTTTVHTEHGLHYRVDLSRAYFSPRLASERKRIADLIEAGETVAD